MQQFQISKSEYSKTRIVDCPAPPLSNGQVRAAIESFSFTANNITYAMVGDMLGYWQFFPPVGKVDPETPWGVLPVWGFATVSESQCVEVSVGDRIFGYFPPATELILEPANISNQRWVDNSAHRQALPPTYNQYSRVKTQPSIDSERSEKEQMLLFPLHMTAYCLYDLLQNAEYFNAEQVIVVSASSKTSIGLAYGLFGDDAAPSVIGLTSDRNKKMVGDLGCYDQEATYTDLSAIDKTKPTAIVDMSGNGELMGQLHQHLGDNMRKTVSVGFTHWEQGAKGEGFIEERSEMFFAPSHIQTRTKELGFDEFDRRSSTYMQSSVAKSRDWLKMTDIAGLKGLQEIFDYVCNGKIAPEAGLIIKL